MAAGAYFIFSGKKSYKYEPAKRDANNESPINDQTLISEEDGKIIEVKPISLAAEKPIKIELRLTTHQGILDFDFTKDFILYDDKNNQYAPVSWNGGSGGHHLSGVLIFPAIASNAKSIKLIIKSAYGIAERKFEWKL